MDFFVISGTTGEYAEQETWNAFACTSEEIARAKTEILNSRLRELGLHTDQGGGYEKDDRVQAFLNENDERFCFDHLTGSQYTCEPVPEATVTIRISEESELL